MTEKEKLEARISDMLKSNFLIAVDSEGAHFRKTISIAHPGIPVFSIKNDLFKIQLFKLIKEFADKSL